MNRISIVRFFFSTRKKRSVKGHSLNPVCYALIQMHMNPASFSLSPVLRLHFLLKVQFSVPPALRLLFRECVLWIAKTSLLLQLTTSPFWQWQKLCRADVLCMLTLRNITYLSLFIAVILLQVGCWEITSEMLTTKEQLGGHSVLYIHCIYCMCVWWFISSLQAAAVVHTCLVYSMVQCLT